MGMKPNQRVALTKQLITNAFLELLKEKSIHRISIRELCENAGINRTTFYNHYGSQYDVLEELTSNYLNEIADALKNANVQDQAGVQSRVVLVLQYMVDNLELTSLLLNQNIDQTFAERVFSLPKIVEMLDLSMMDETDKKRKKAKTDFAIYGSYKILQDWINDPERVSPEKETELLLSLARKACS